MNRNKAWVAPAMRHRANATGCCEKDCPGYEHCIGEGEDIWAEAAEMIESQECAKGTLIEAMAGVQKAHLYFAVKAPIDADKLPEDGYIAHINHEERRYIRLINDMAYGTAVFSRTLEPWEIARARLTSAPVE